MKVCFRLSSFGRFANEETYLDEGKKMILWCLQTLGLVLLAIQVIDGGLLDWARSDKIDVNLPWLPCE